MLYHRPYATYTHRRLLLTYTEDVKTKPLCDRLADQLVGKAVKSNMSAQTQVALLFVLRDKKKQRKQNQTLKSLVVVRVGGKKKNTHGEDIRQTWKEPGEKVFTLSGK